MDVSAGGVRVRWADSGRIGTGELVDVVIRLEAPPEPVPATLEGRGWVLRSDGFEAAIRFRAPLALKDRYPQIRVF